jgi:hypothetical protein
MITSEFITIKVTAPSLYHRRVKITFHYCSAIPVISYLLLKFLEILFLNFSKSEGFRIDYDPGGFSNILNSFNMFKFGFTGMVPAE